MPYFDGFVLPVPTANRQKFIDHASLADPVFVEGGALRIFECWQADVKKGEHTDFFGAVDAKDDESIVFSWIEWPDKAARDAAMKKMMDPDNCDERMDPEKNPMPFDGARMIYGGFEPLFAAGDFSNVPYVQGFIVPVPKDAKDKYRDAAEMAWTRLFQPAGALCVLEAWSDDVRHGKQTDFYRAVKAGEEEAVVFSFLAWPSREACDEAASGMTPDPDMPTEMPFDGKRLTYGGFEPVVVLGA